MKKIFSTSLLCLSANSFAFGDLGHATVGYIAEKSLSPQGTTFVYSIMGAEPMAISATWPDQVREDERFESFAPYHFFDFPENVSYENIPAGKVQGRSADTILIKGPDLLKKKKLNTLQKQVIFRYYTHIMGDIHQPLHVGNTTDVGGNLCEVLVPQINSDTPKKMNLHSFWDSALPDLLKEEALAKAKLEGKVIKYFSYKHLAEFLLEDAKASGVYGELKNQIKKGQRIDWFGESRELHPQVYPDGKTVPVAERAYCRFVNPENGTVENGKYDAAKIPVLTPEYIKNALAVVKRRILLAGMRLQTEIDQMAVGQKPWSAKAQHKFFKRIMPAKVIKERAPSSTKAKVVPTVETTCEH